MIHHRPAVIFSDADAMMRRNMLKPGQYRSKTYRSWESMKHRCKNPKYGDFHRYGGRGITYCKEWESFENFLRDMGERPSGKTLDRINGDGNYEPANCRWATAVEQSRGRAIIRRYEYNGQMMLLTDIASLSGVTLKLLHQRINRDGMPMRRAALKK